PRTAAHGCCHGVGRARVLPWEPQAGRRPVERPRSRVLRAATTSLPNTPLMRTPLRILAAGLATVFALAPVMGPAQAPGAQKTDSSKKQKPDLPPAGRRHVSLTP